MFKKHKFKKKKNVELISLKWPIVLSSFKGNGKQNHDEKGRRLLLNKINKPTEDSEKETGGNYLRNYLNTRIKA